MQDSLIKWDGPFPYELLSRFGVAQESTIPAINDVGFEALTPEEEHALNELAVVKRRLLVDFFSYQLGDDEWPITQNIP